MPFLFTLPPSLVHEYKLVLWKPWFGFTDPFEELISLSNSLWLIKDITIHAVLRMHLNRFLYPSVIHLSGVKRGELSVLTMYFCQELQCKDS